MEGGCLNSTRGGWEVAQVDAERRVSVQTDHSRVSEPQRSIESKVGDLEANAVVRHTGPCA